MNTAIWMMVAGGTGLVLIIVARLVSPSPAVELGERGILDRRLRLGWIRWDEIEGAYQPSVADRNGLHLKLKLTERLLRRVRRRPVETSGPSLDVRLDLSKSEFSPAEVLQEIMNRSGGSAVPQS